MSKVNRSRLHNLRLAYSPQTVTKTASLLAISLGCSVLVGWLFDIEVLKSFFSSNQATMKANTALCFVLSGLSLGLLLKRGQRGLGGQFQISRVCAVAVAVIGLLTLSQYIFGWNLGIDELLFRDLSNTVTTISPGRMGLNTATNFVLVGIALLLLGQRNRRSYWYAQVLSLIAALVSLQALMGYAYKVQVLYGIAPYTTSMALHTVLTFMMLCIGILLTRTDQGLMRVVTSDRPAGLLARRLLFLAIALPLLLGWLIVQGQRKGYYDAAFAITLFALVLIVIFAISIWKSAALIDKLYTERDRTLENLKANEQKLNSFVDGNIIGILFGDVHGNITQANDELLRIIGYTREDLLSGRIRWSDITPPELLYLDEQAIAEAKIKGACTSYEKEYIRKDTSRVPILAGFVLLGEQREEAVAFILDLTERKQVLAALQTSEERYRILAENVPQLVWINRPDGFVEYFNQRWLDYTGLQPNETLGWDWQQVIHPDDLVTTIEQWTNSLRTGGNYEVQYRLRRSDGVYRWHIGRGVALRDEHGQIVKWFGTCTDIDDRQRIEQQLQEANERVINILESISDNFTALDRQWRITYVNQATAKLNNSTPEEMIGKNHWEEWSWSVGTKIESEYHRAVAQQVAVDFEVFSEPLSKWFEIHAYPSADGLNIYSRDITERKQAEAALKESEERYRQLIELSPEGIFIQYEEEFVFVNSQCLQLFGATNSEQIIGKSITDFVHPDFHAIVKQRIQQLIEQRTEVPLIEQKWLRLDGTVFDAEVKAAPFTYQDKPGAQVIIRDITQRKQVQAALQASEERFRFLAESIPQIVWTSRPDGWLDYYNQRWFDYTGMTLEETQGWGWSRVLHPDDLQMCIERWTQAVETGEPLEIEYRFKRASDGEYHWHLGRALALRDQNGRIVKWFGTCTDIHDQKQMLAERDRALASEQAARAAAETSNRLKDEFLAVVSHELRSPLNAMLGWVQMLRAGKLNETMTAKALETIERNARAQAQLIEDLLDVSRIITGKIRLNVRTCQLVPIIEAAIDTVHLAADAKEIRLQSILDPLAGPVSGDSERLQQVIWNLLSNAIKFTPKKGRVQIRLERINSHVEITVNDTGIGISSDFLPYVFERFRQEDSSTTRSYSGLGLGLAIVRHLVELHGGTVSVASPGEGQGTTFTVKLPLMPVARLETTNPERVHPTVSSGVPFDNLPNLAGVRVLVVDDQADTRDFITTVLRECGAEVKAVESAASVLEAIPQWQPDILVSDIGMPEEDGYSLIRKVRALESQRERQIPAVALTAYARVEDRIQALSAGFAQHITKPVEPAELVAVVANLARQTL